MSEQVEDFLEHFGVRGMKWGRRSSKGSDSGSSNSSGGGSSSSSPAKAKGTEGGGGSDAPKPKMSNKKKIAIAVGVGAVLAIGTAVAVSSMNKNMDVPIGSLLKSASTSKGKELVASARKATSPKFGFDSKSQGKSFTPTLPKAAASNPGLTLPPRGAASNAPRASTTLPPRSNSSNTASNRGFAGAGPDLNTLSSLINGGPQISYNAKTGQYETK